MVSPPTEPTRTLPAQRVRQFIASRLDRKSELGLGLTVSVLIFALAVWTLSGLLDAILDNQMLVRIDAVVENWFHAHSTPLGLGVFTGITYLGSVVSAAVVVLVAVYLWRVGATFWLWNWLGANLGSLAVEYVLKSTVHRSRPQYAARYLHGHSYSFPSGHTMASTVCYFLLAYLISTHPAITRGRQRVAWSIAVVVVAAVGFSRLYLGVHYPSDVLGGLTAGLAWLGACGATRRLVAAHRGMTGAGWTR